MIPLLLFKTIKQNKDTNIKHHDAEIEEKDKSDLRFLERTLL